MQTRAHSVACEEDKVEQGLDELEQYLHSREAVPQAIHTDVAEDSTSLASDDPRRVGLDELDRFIERQRGLTRNSERS